MFIESDVDKDEEEDLDFLFNPFTIAIPSLDSNKTIFSFLTLYK